VTLSIRWLGVAGFHIRTAEHSILIDPYFSRLPFRKMFIGKIEPDLQVIHSMQYQADAIFVSHSHVDHLLDVPTIAREQNIPVYGSANTCHILNAFKFPTDQINRIEPGDSIQIGVIKILVRSCAHIFTPGFRPGVLPEKLEPPLRARQYVMDNDYSFLIEAGGLTLLTDPGQSIGKPFPVDILTLAPFHTPAELEQILVDTQPRYVIPSHWDDFLRPISKPIRPMLQPLHHEWPPIGRADMEKFAHRVEQLSPHTLVMHLDLFQEIEIQETNSGK
jgi:L-ascorbate metabolism protein UlaG (beta-lactamase superfamily)